MAAPTLIYCDGRNRRFMEIAKEAGFALGAQVPPEAVSPIVFADQNWKTPNREGYMKCLAAHRPKLATVMDWEREEQLPEVLSWAEEAAQYVETVIIIPKVMGGIPRIPKRIGGVDVRLGYSVPTKFSATSLPSWEFRGWPVHLLGGSPHAQMRLIHYFDVQSADGNMINRLANACAYWSETLGPRGHFIKVGAWEEGDANYEAFRRSCVNIISAWKELYG